MSDEPDKSVKESREWMRVAHCYAATCVWLEHARQDVAHYEQERDKYMAELLALSPRLK